MYFLSNPQHRRAAWHLRVQWQPPGHQLVSLEWWGVGHWQGGADPASYSPGKGQGLQVSKHTGCPQTAFWADGHTSSSSAPGMAGPDYAPCCPFNKGPLASTVSHTLLWAWDCWSHSRGMRGGSCQESRRRIPERRPSGLTKCPLQCPPALGQASPQPCPQSFGIWRLPL